METNMAKDSSRSSQVRSTSGSTATESDKASERPSTNKDR